MSSPVRLRFQRLRFMLCVIVVIIAIIGGCDGTLTPTLSSPITPTFPASPPTIVSPLTPPPVPPTLIPSPTRPPSPISTPTPT